MGSTTAGNQPIRGARAWYARPRQGKRLVDKDTPQPRVAGVDVGFDSATRVRRVERRAASSGCSSSRAGEKQSMAVPVIPVTMTTTYLGQNFARSISWVMYGYERYRMNVFRSEFPSAKISRKIFLSILSRH
uniref:Uncharacterized protein n=1 Tax=Oryza sativa subsp. japonica TaxID=39947 RepID=Q6YV28_ORYSJ|nr:hypothetical protein [Oryza sativa Japonica Group]BAD08101.1 hypothetical protein [Oryza sativa Japonica Group]